MTATISKSRTRRSKALSRSGPALNRPRVRIPLPVYFIAAGLWAIVVLLLYGGGEIKLTNLAVGQRAPETVIAEVDFQCEDVARTELNMQQAANSVLPVFALDDHNGPALRSVRRLFSELSAYRSSTNSDPAADGLDEQLPTAAAEDQPLAPRDLLRLIPEGTETQVLAAVTGALQQVWNQGILSRTEKATSFQDVALYRGIWLKDPATGDLVRTPIEELLMPDQALDRVVREVRRRPPAGLPAEDGLRLLLAPYVTPNLVYQNEQTEALREQARSAVDPVEIKVRAGSTLVEAGERITPQILEQLREHNRKLSSLISPYDRALRTSGNAGLLLLMLISFGGMLHVLAPHRLRSKSSILLMALISLVTILAAKGLLVASNTTRIVDPSVVEYLVPLALSPMLATILIGGPAAVVVGFWSSLASSLLLGTSFLVFIMGLAVTMAAVLATRDVARRSRVFRAGLWAGLTMTLFVVCMALYNQHPVSVLLGQATAALASGIAAALLTLLLLPPFEYLFGITTDIRLLELSDMGHPLLQRMAIEAPGTYHHSLMVANLAQSACQEIGANALLVRVCAYFHDIGKLTKPECFIENTQYQRNPHDELSPSMSTLIIISHVKEGITLARRHKLPPPIIQGIREHHGTSTVSYFYHRAIQQTEAKTNGDAEKKKEAGAQMPDPQDFRYPGPKPTTPEMAVLLLADSVEAASRSMEKPTPSRIQNLVEKMAEAKLKDGQLDNCGLTFNQLSRIKASLIFTLTNMLHGRVPYPDNESDSSDEPNRDSAAKETARNPRAVAGDTHSES